MTGHGPPGRRSRPASHRPAEIVEKALTNTDAPMVPPTTDLQVMPDLTNEEYAALRADIAERGIVVPVVVDQDGRLLDGHHRRRAADELGVSCPQEVHQVADDDKARDVALALNLARRHLTREQRRELVAREIDARPGDSDRAIARRLGCDHKTIGAVRRSGELPQSGPIPVMDRQRAEEVTERIRACVDEMDDDLSKLPPFVAVGVLTAIMRSTEKRADELPGGVLSAMRRHIIHPRIDALLEQVEIGGTR